jgi:hypothetical protein
VEKERRRRRSSRVEARHAVAAGSPCGMVRKLLRLLF